MTVEESKILETVTVDSSQNGLSMVALVLMNENQEHIEKVGVMHKLLVAKSLIVDVVSSV